METIGRSLSDGLGAILGALPALIGALLILIIGFIIAKVLQGVATKALEAMGFEGWMEKGGIKQFFDRSQTQQTPLSILGKLVFWLIFFIAITMAVDTLGISAISDVLAQFIAYIPQIIAAILILATLLATFVAGIVRGATGSEVAGSVAQYGIIVFAAFAALTQLGIAEELIAPTFLILLGGVALAAALAFGLGGQSVAQQIVQQGYEKSGEARQQIQQHGAFDREQRVHALGLEAGDLAVQGPLRGARLLGAFGDRQAEERRRPDLLVGELLGTETQ